MNPLEKKSALRKWTLMTVGGAGSTLLSIGILAALQGDVNLGWLWPLFPLFAVLFYGGIVAFLVGAVLLIVAALRRPS